MSNPPWSAYTNLCMNQKRTAHSHVVLYSYTQTETKPELMLVLRCALNKIMRI